MFTAGRLRFALAIGVMLAFAIAMQTANAQGAVCDELQALYSIHGEDLSDYLNEKGRSCLTASLAPTDIPSSTPLLSERGYGSKDIFVDLEFHPGVYRLNLVSPRQGPNYEDFSVSLEDVIDTPVGCFTTEFGRSIFFPSQAVIDEKCHIFATLDVNNLWMNRFSWEVSITTFVPPAAGDDAIGWSLEGRGEQYQEVDITFRPGIYRLDVDSPKTTGWGYVSLQKILSDPARCFGTSYTQLPYQIRLESTCRVYALVNVELFSGDHNTTWRASIRKLD